MHFLGVSSVHNAMLFAYLHFVGREDGAAQVLMPRGWPELWGQAQKLYT